MRPNQPTNKWYNYPLSLVCLWMFGWLDLSLGWSLGPSLCWSLGGGWWAAVGARETDKPLRGLGPWLELNLHGQNMSQEKNIPKLCVVCKAWPNQTDCLRHVQKDGRGENPWIFVFWLLFELFSCSLMFLFSYFGGVVVGTFPPPPLNFSFVFLIFC